MVRRLGPAPVQDAEVALDITGRAPGLVLELQLVEAVPVALVDGRKQSRTVETDRVLVTPSRPGAVLAEARQRGVPTP
jgi:hypothetical protein